MMLGVRGFAKPCFLPCLLTFPQLNSVSSSHSIPPYKTQFSFFSHALLFTEVRKGLCPIAVKKARRDKGGILEVDKFDDEEEYEEEVVEEGGDDDENDYDGVDEEDEMLLPLENMKKWFDNKPRGFGEGKEYDTSVEDKLLEELEQSRKAQLVNINNLKNNPILPTPKGKPQQPEKVPNGIRVRLSNLPKKKNIHRDLQSAFKGFPGIIDIVPVVSGNKRTREPICKGLAFVDLKSQEDANRFIQIFSRQSIAFGKVQKQIKCEITDPQLPDSAHKRSSEDSYALPVLAMEEDVDVVAADIVIDDGSLQSGEEDSFDESDGLNDDLDIDRLEYVMDEEESSEALEMDFDNSLIPEMESTSKATSLNKPERPKAVKKKSQPKTKGEKIQKLNIPGSAKRLKIKEKALLTGVFSKYGVNAASSSRDS